MAALVVLFGALPIILIGAKLFTNAIEHVGMMFGVSEGVTGSLLAAVGTALPETIVPILASFQGGGGAHVAVGAVLGAPLMLSTLTMAVIGLTAVLGRGFGGCLTPEPRGLRRDIDWFLALFALAFLGLFLPLGLARPLLAVVLVAGYGGYVRATVRASSELVDCGHGTRASTTLSLARLRLQWVPGLRYLQLALSLVLILAGAQLFVVGIERLGRVAHVSVLVLALVIVPIATELPEKVNSILWVRRHQDTLAFGNVTGALVFQGSLLPALGLMLTPWRASPLLVVSMLTTMMGVGYLRIRSASAAGIRAGQVMAVGLLYVAFVGYLLAI